MRRHEEDDDKKGADDRGGRRRGKKIGRLILKHLQCWEVLPFVPLSASGA